MATKKKYCCDDMRITVEGGYAHIKITTSGNKKYYRFSGHTINYCPYCAERLDAQSIDFKGIVRRQLKEFIRGGITK